MTTVADFADKAQQDRNKAAGHTLCERCSGTGNELFQMYRACEECGGSGVAERYGALSRFARWRLERKKGLTRRWAWAGMTFGFGPHADGQARSRLVSKARWFASHYLCIGQWFWNGKDDCHRCGAQPSDVDFLMKRIGWRRAECIESSECQQIAEEVAAWESEDA